MENPEYYDGFRSDFYEERNSGRDYRDTWDSVTTEQYIINIASELSIDEFYAYECDGERQSAKWHITDIRQILKILRKIEYEL